MYSTHHQKSNVLTNIYKSISPTTVRIHLLQFSLDRATSLLFPAQRVLEIRRDSLSCITRRYLRIVHGCSTLNRSDLTENCARLIRDLLRLNVEQRLGCGRRGALDVLEHPWFATMDFWRLYQQEYIAPYLPIRRSLLSVPEVTDALLRFTAKNHFEEEFRDF